MQALWMVLAAFLFASMGVCVKIASEHFNSAELVCYRGLIGMLILWLLARSQKVRLATQYPGMHAWRSLVGVASLGAWFYAIAHLPLATAMTLNYMSSVWIAAFLVGGTLLAWRPSAAAPRPALQGPLVLTVLTGFAGVVMMLRPSLDQHQAFAGLIGLMSGLTAAFAYMQVVALSREDVRHAFEVMASLEGLAGELAVRRVTDDDLAGLRALQADMEAAHRRRDLPAYYRINRAIHDRIHAIAANPVLAQTHETLQARLKRIRFIGNEKPEAWAAAVAEHEEMMVAINARNGDALAEVLGRHLDHTLDRVRDSI